MKKNWFFLTNHRFSSIYSADLLSRKRLAPLHRINFEKFFLWHRSDYSCGVRFYAGDLTQKNRHIHHIQDDHSLKRTSRSNDNSLGDAAGHATAQTDQALPNPLKQFGPSVG